jgi:hypothetical protein
MAETGSHPRLTFALAAALGVALLVIAFLVGRESARPTADVRSPLPPVPSVEGETRSEASPVRDAWRLRDEEYASIDAQRGSVVMIDERPDGTIVLSNTKGEHETATAPVNDRDARPEGAPKGSPDPVSEYFLQMDTIRSNAGAGDPNSFAMDLIKAGIGGATSGFDQLVADTDRMSAEIGQLTPPTSCVGYHEATLESLAEARGMLESMKDAITTRDLQALNAIALQASELQARTKALAALQEQIRGATR